MSVSSLSSQSIFQLETYTFIYIQIQSSAFASRGTYLPDWEERKGRAPCKTNRFATCVTGNVTTHCPPETLYTEALQNWRTQANIKDLSH